MNKIICDYCGDREEIVTDDKDACSNVIGLYLKWDVKPEKISRRICVPCWVKVFDTVLGKPKVTRDDV